MAQNKYEFLKTGEKEYIKAYLVYDGSSRLTTIYEARANADHGAYCLKTTYAYDGTSNRVQKSKEEDATWDSSWDI